MFELLMY